MLALLNEFTPSNTLAWLYRPEGVQRLDFFLGEVLVLSHTED